MDVYHQFFAMNGYAYYVWPSFGVATIIMVMMVIASFRSLRRAQKSLAMIQESTITTGDEA